MFFRSLLSSLTFETNRRSFVFKYVCETFLEIRLSGKIMSSGGYKIRNQAEVHFITFAVVEWVDVFTRKEYRDILVDSIKYCQAERELKLHCWCIMSNHVHLISSARNRDATSMCLGIKTPLTGRSLLPVQ